MTMKARSLWRNEKGNFMKLCFRELSCSNLQSSRAAVTIETKELSHTHNALFGGAALLIEESQDEEEKEKNPRP